MACGLSSARAETLAVRAHRASGASAEVTANAKPSPAPPQVGAVVAGTEQPIGGNGTSSGMARILANGDRQAEYHPEAAQLGELS